MNIFLLCVFGKVILRKTTTNQTMWTSNKDEQHKKGPKQARESRYFRNALNDSYETTNYSRRSLQMHPSSPMINLSNAFFPVCRPLHPRVSIFPPRRRRSAQKQASRIRTTHRTKNKTSLLPSPRVRVSVSLAQYHGRTPCKASPSHSANYHP